MKIKNQFRLFILGTIAVPLISAITFPVYHYLTSPERILIKGYKEIRAVSNLPITDDDWNVLYNALKRTPPDVQIAIILNESGILLSTIPELKSGTPFNDIGLITLVNRTSKRYFYQFFSVPTESSTVQIDVISRVIRDADKFRKETYRFLMPALIVFTVFELFCITIIVHISNTVSRSITVLEEKTQRIAAGDFNTELHTDPKGRDSNEITSLIENLDKMRKSLKEDQERRTRFIMGISHDLRTPVAVIKGYTEAISDGVADDPDAIKNALAIIGTKTNQLETMIDTLISFVRLNNREWREKLISCPIEPAITEFAKSSVMTGAVFKRNITASIEVPANIKVPYDKQLFQRALENLFSNALRYTRDGDQISITACEAAGNVILTVKDSGQGIAKKDLDHIFELFYRGTNSRREEGMGIGLAVVKNIIDTHGWSIKVESEEGKGAAFIITIPEKNSETKAPAV